MPTPNDPNLIHSLSSLGTWQREERVSLRETVANQADRIADMARRNLELEARVRELTCELAATETARDEWMRRARLAECQLRTAQKDHEAQQSAVERAAWRGRDNGVVRCIATMREEKP